tara:strand:+ start:1102 stop:1641 length:540 start_codon:yes stop_codon:yes gene_type:complete
MNTLTFIKNYFDDIYKYLNSINYKNFLKTSKLVIDLKKTNKIIFVGNGGSASISNHCATDFNKFLKKRSITFNEPNLITCYANDYGHENWMKEALKTHGNKNDILFLISSSGMSKNIINCAKQAKKMKIKIIGLSGFKKNNNLSKMADISFWVNSKSYNQIEMTHHVWLLLICDYISKN